MEIAITTMSSKGQIVIPKEMRSRIKEGEKIVILERDGQFVLKLARNLDKNFKDDLEFARRTEDAWKSYDRGEFKSSSAEDFLKELSKW
ncbi:AbrB/MazE/SpoVT family DNA-binding domain-containing protein [Candidatus Woesearchaeota archaeon]|nr:AbrB/MazE/SpoVT family DNA-binding domain-containing protein [Candidatus Woesearchaeota archaeon]